MIFTDEFILAVGLCLMLGIMGYKMRMPSLSMVSSVGWVCLALSAYNVSEDLLLLALMITVAFAQVIASMR